jgi:hypothetical protein
MHDFNEIFKEQLANEQPWTQGTIRSSLHGHSFHLTTRQLMEKSKELKKKIGCRRLRYYINQHNSVEMRMVTFWDDEFPMLQTALRDCMFAGYDGLIPKFTRAYN